MHVVCVCMYACMCVRECVYRMLGKHMHVYDHMYSNSCAYVCVYTECLVSTHTCMFMITCTQTHVHMGIYILHLCTCFWRMSRRVHLYMYTCMRMCLILSAPYTGSWETKPSIYTYIHTYTCSRLVTHPEKPWRKNLPPILRNYWTLNLYIHAYLHLQQASRTPRKTVEKEPAPYTEELLNPQSIHACIHTCIHLQ